jgi:choline monooxygenase
MAVTAMPRTLPYDWYVEPSVLRLEQERIFGRYWQYVARADQVAAPGCFTTGQVGLVPVVVVRGHDGELRGFVNVCRHRGYLLCEGSGRREALQCPYHAWTYGLDGSLRAAPRADEPGFDRDGLGLVPVRVEALGPFVFANLAADSLSLAEQLAELPGVLRDAGVDIEALTFHERADAGYDANWKVCVENFLECYHCTVAHPSFAQAIDVTPEAYTLETRRWFSTQWGAPRDGGNGVYDARGEVARGQFHLLFPGTAINVMPGRQNLSIGPILPVGPERTFRFLDYFFAGEPDGDWLREFMQLDAQVGAEDRVLVERVQRGIRSGALAHGALLPRSERLIAHFQELVVETLGAEA